MTAGPLRWLVIGIGDIAKKRVLPAIVAEPRSRLAGIVTRDPAKAEPYGVPAWTDLDRALAECPADAVYVATPVFLHAPQTIAALRAGRHVALRKAHGAPLRRRPCHGARCPGDRPHPRHRLLPPPVPQGGPRPGADRGGRHRPAGLRRSYRPRLERNPGGLPRLARRRAALRRRSAARHRSPSHRPPELSCSASPCASPASFPPSCSPSPWKTTPPS